MRKSKRILTAVLVTGMVGTMLPVSAMAYEAGDTIEAAEVQDVAEQADGNELVEAEAASEIAGETVMVEDQSEDREELFGVQDEDGTEESPYTITGTDFTIAEGGYYYIDPSFTGLITISTGAPVTLVGSGIDDTAKRSNVFIDCTVTADLTLQDLFISDTTKDTYNVIDFTGTGNALDIEGSVVLDYDCGYTTTNDSVLHVGVDAGLKITGAGTYYQYNCTQGGGIGGTTGEMNGEIEFDMDGSAFIKGTKQGAVIGAGARANGTGTPGSVTFTAGSYNLISNSRGAVIGGAAGSNGGSEGTTVYFNGGSININVDWSGAAVGGGGYDKGNDSSGGTAYFNGGSVRVYVDKNAAQNLSEGYNGETITEGINDAAITARRLNAAGEKVYRCTVDSTGVDANETGSAYNISVDGSLFFSGNRHQYGFIQEGLDKGDQLTITSTVTNWVKIDEPCFYLYLTGEDHTIDVNGVQYNAVWDETTSSFTTTQVSESKELAITSQPQDTSAIIGKTTTMSVGAEGDGLTYQWYYSADDGQSWKKASIAGNKTDTITIKSDASRFGYSYCCVVTDASGNSIVSDSAELTVLPKSVYILSQDVSVNAVLDNSASISVNAGSTEEGDLTYQWYYSTDNGKTWKKTSVAGNKTAKITMKATEERFSNQYRCVITDAAGISITSKAASLVQVANPVSVTEETTTVGDTTATMAVTAASTVEGNLTYQWYYSSDNGQTWKKTSLKGNKTAEITMKLTQERYSNQYRCIVTDAAGNTAVSPAYQLPAAE